MKRRQLQQIAIGGLSICFGFIVAVSTFQRGTSSVSQQRSMGAAAVTLANQNNKANSTTVSECAAAASDAYHNEPLFPIVPATLRDENGCNQTLWNINVFAYFISKTLKIINYVVAAAAVILTFYAGLLYLLGGSGNEKMVTQAKTALTATFVGLTIVILARIIIYTTFFAFDDKTFDSNTIQTLIDKPTQN